jgi:hypothetical protein
MAGDDLRDLLTRDPFVPFRVRLSSGDHFDIRDPLSAALMKSRLFIAVPNSDKSIYVPYLHIAALETLNGRRNGRARGRNKHRP